MAWVIGRQGVVPVMSKTKKKRARKSSRNSRRSRRRTSTRGAIPIVRSKSAASKIGAGKPFYFVSGGRTRLVKKKRNGQWQYLPMSGHTGLRKNPVDPDEYSLAPLGKTYDIPFKRGETRDEYDKRYPKALKAKQAADRQRQAAWSQREAASKYETDMAEFGPRLDKLFNTVFLSLMKQDPEKAWQLDRMAQQFGKDAALSSMGFDANKPVKPQIAKAKKLTAKQMIQGAMKTGPRAVTVGHNLEMQKLLDETLGIKAGIPKTAASALSKKIADIVGPKKAKQLVGKIVDKGKPRKTAAAQKATILKAFRGNVTQRDIAMIESACKISFPKALAAILKAGGFSTKSRIGGKVAGAGRGLAKYNAAIRVAKAAGIPASIYKTLSDPDDILGLAGASYSKWSGPKKRRSSKKRKSSSRGRKKTTSKTSKKRRKARKNPGSWSPTGMRGSGRGFGSDRPYSLVLKNNPLSRYGSSWDYAMKKNSRRKSRKTSRRRRKKNPTFGQTFSSIGTYLMNDGITLGVGGAALVTVGKLFERGVTWVGDKAGYPGTFEGMGRFIAAGGALFGGFHLAGMADDGSLKRMPGGGIIDPLFGKVQDEFGGSRKRSRSNALRAAAVASAALIAFYEPIVQWVGLGGYLGITDERTYDPSGYGILGLGEREYDPSVLGLGESEAYPGLYGLGEGPTYDGSGTGNGLLGIGYGGLGDHGSGFSVDPRHMTSGQVPDHMAGMNGFPSFMS